jgi:amidophosphoribosyltransferase
VYFASAAPPVRYPNVYGIDMPTAKELIAYKRSEDEIGELIGADWLVFQNLDDLIMCSLDGNPDIKSFDCAVFDGEYVTGDIDENYLERLESQRSDEAQDERRATQSEDDGMGLHNDI